MDTALVFTCTGPVVGREAKVVDLFEQSKDFFGKPAADGKCSELEVFFSPSAPFNFATGEQTQPFVDRFATVGSELGYI
jgi:hypothetical protein